MKTNYPKQQQQKQKQQQKQQQQQQRGIKQRKQSLLHTLLLSLLSLCVENMIMIMIPMIIMMTIPMVEGSEPNVVVSIQNNDNNNNNNNNNGEEISWLAKRGLFGSKEDDISGQLIHAPPSDVFLCEYFERETNIARFPIPRDDDHSVILMVPRGNCTYERKAYAAYHIYGASAVLVYDNLSARYSWDDETNRVLFPKSEDFNRDYECEQGYGIVSNITLDPPPYNGTELDPLLDISLSTSTCVLEQTRTPCESQLCLVTSHLLNSTDYPVCCAWDLPATMGRDPTAGNTNDIVAVFLTIRQSKQVINYLGMTINISHRPIGKQNLSLFLLWLFGVIVTGIASWLPTKDYSSFSQRLSKFKQERNNDQQQQANENGDNNDDDNNAETPSSNDYMTPRNGNNNPNNNDSNNMNMNGNEEEMSNDFWGSMSKLQTPDGVQKKERGKEGKENEEEMTPLTRDYEESTATNTTTTNSTEAATTTAAATATGAGAAEAATKSSKDEKKTKKASKKNKKNHKKSKRDNNKKEDPTSEMENGGNNGGNNGNNNDNNNGQETWTLHSLPPPERRQRKKKFRIAGTNPNDNSDDDDDDDNNNNNNGSDDEEENEKTGKQLAEEGMNSLDVTKVHHIPSAEATGGSVNMEISHWHVLTFVLSSSIMLFVLFYWQFYDLIFIFYGFGCAGAVSYIIFSPAMVYLVPKLGNDVTRELNKPVLCGYNGFDVTSQMLGFLWALIWVWYGMSRTNPATYPFFWVTLNIFGVCICLMMIDAWKMTNMKIGALFMIVIFFYDIFFVFLTPLIFDGESVMLTVAQGGSGDAADDFCYRYPEEKACKGLNFLPMLFILPVISGYGTTRVVLGLGDIILPGFLICFAARVDEAARLVGKHTTLEIYVPEKWYQGYFFPLMVSYAVGLFLAFLSLSLTNQGQPALLYIVPCCLGTFCFVGRNEFRSLWRGARQIRLADKLKNKCERVWGKERMRRLVAKKKRQRRLSEERRLGDQEESNGNHNDVQNSPRNRASEDRNGLEASPRRSRSPRNRGPRRIDAAGQITPPSGGSRRSRRVPKSSLPPVPVLNDADGDTNMNSGEQEGRRPRSNRGRGEGGRGSGRGGRGKGRGRGRGSKRTSKPSENQDDSLTMDIV